MNKKKKLKLDVFWLTSRTRNLDGEISQISMLISRSLLQIYSPPKI